jgi:hypothetical protein
VQGWSWFDFKDTLTAASGLSHDAIHVHAGLVILVFGAAVFHRSPSPLRVQGAWLLVLVLTVANELADAVDWSGWTGQPNWHESMKDAVNTLPWSTFLAANLLARKREFEWPPSGPPH